MTHPDLPSLFQNDLLVSQPDAIRRDLAAWWMARAAVELEVARAFERILETLKSQRVAESLLQTASNAIKEEREHAQLSEQLARLCDPGVATAAPPVSQGLESIPHSLRAIVQILVTTCIQETVATAFMKRCNAGCESECVRRTFDVLLEDEDTHTSFGWQYMASLPKPVTDEIAPHIPTIVGVCMGVWRERVRAMPDLNRSDLGIPARAEMAATVDESLEKDVLPRLREIFPTLSSAAR